METCLSNKLFAFYLKSIGHALYKLYSNYPLSADGSLSIEKTTHHTFVSHNFRPFQNIYLILKTFLTFLRSAILQFVRHSGMIRTCAYR